MHRQMLDVFLTFGGANQVAASTESYPLHAASCFLTVLILRSLLLVWPQFFFSHRRGDLLRRGAAHRRTTVTRGIQLRRAPPCRRKRLICGPNSGVACVRRRKQLRRPTKNHPLQERMVLILFHLTFVIPLPPTQAASRRSRSGWRRNS